MPRGCADCRGPRTSGAGELGTPKGAGQGRWVRRPGAALRGSAPRSLPGPSPPLPPPPLPSPPGSEASERAVGGRSRRGRVAAAGRGGGLQSTRQEEKNPPTNASPAHPHLWLPPCGVSCSPWPPSRLPSVWVWGRPEPPCWDLRRPLPPRPGARPRPRRAARYSRPRGRITVSARTEGPLLGLAGYLLSRLLCAHPSPTHTHALTRSLPGACVPTLPGHTHPLPPSLPPSPSLRLLTQQPQFPARPSQQSWDGASRMLPLPAPNLPFSRMRKLRPEAGEWGERGTDKSAETKRCRARLTTELEGRGRKERGRAGPGVLFARAAWRNGARAGVGVGGQRQTA